jgi:HK97 family phage major capsid protein
MKKITLIAFGFALLAAAAMTLGWVGEAAAAVPLLGDANAFSLQDSLMSGLAVMGLGSIKELRDRKAALVKEADGLSVKVNDETASEDEAKRLDAIMADNGDLAKVNASIAREERLMDERRSMEAVRTINDDTDEEEADRAPAAAKKPPETFSSFGEQLQAIAAAGMNKGRGVQDDRLTWQAAAGANEAVPSEGGFLVQQDFSTMLLEQMHEMGELLSRVRRVPITVGNGIKLPAVDETSRANGSRFGGVQAYWADEAVTVTASKPKFYELDMRLKKLLAIGYTTEELLADAPALESVMNTAFTEELTFKTEDGIINGTGAGQLLGILNSGALISVAKDSGQAADTISTANVLSMWATTPIRSRKNLVWVINQNIEPQLYQLTLGTGTAVVLLYTPPGVNGNNTPYGLLLGRPVIPIEYAATLGDVGDIILFDPQQYVMIDKGGLQQAASMHVRFLYDEMTFRFVFRVDGQPVWKSAVTPYKGTASSISPYVALAAR